MGQAVLPSPPSPLSVHKDRPEAWRLQLARILALLCSENKCLSCLWGSKRTAPISSGGFSGEGPQSCAWVSHCRPRSGALLLDLAGLPEMEELHQLRKHSERLAVVQGGLP